ncbi:hypothetical protein M407DRAFT_19534 [Tulasnella calospora MUT 4182]|uniref:Uncharacterized protein n=1 Tax=Tulasnella calospora MUT 4182 TaxID=1051891 RepID=A0A0C3QRM2_9AGAM|nr:hypothetical protein M407DRAFT_19534 [Tulasnella calospora MUT 4182]
MSFSTPSFDWGQRRGRLSRMIWCAAALVSGMGCVGRPQWGTSSRALQERISPEKKQRLRMFVYWRMFINERGGAWPLFCLAGLPLSTTITPSHFGPSSQSTPASLSAFATSIDITPVLFPITTMVSTTATPGGDSLAVDVASAATTTLQAPQPLPPTGFVSCPTQHGLGRSGLGSANDENLFQAIMSAIASRLECLSLSDEPALESPTTTVRYPVYTATPARTPSTPSRNSARPRLLNLKPKLFGKLSKGFKAGLQKSLLKRGNTKKTGAPIPPLPVSPCSPVEHQGSLIGRIVESRGGLSVSDANPYSRDTRFQELFDFTVRAPPTHTIVKSTFLQPGFSDAFSSTSSTVRTAGDEVADDTMDEDEQQPPSARSD